MEDYLTCGLMWIEEKKFPKVNLSRFSEACLSGFTSKMMQGKIGDVKGYFYHAFTVIFLANTYNFATLIQHVIATLCMLT